MKRRGPILELHSSGNKDAADDADGPERGVYEEDLAPAGESWYKVVTSKGRIGIVHLPNELVLHGDQTPVSTLEQLWRMLDHGDPPPPTLRRI